METETDERHQPLPDRAAEVKHGGDDLGELAGEQHGLGAAHDDVGQTEPLEDARQPECHQVIAPALGVDDKAEKDEDDGPLDDPEDDLPPGDRVSELALGGDHETDPHDPDKPGEVIIRLAARAHVS